MTPEGDQILAYIRQVAADLKVPPAQQEQVVMAAAKAVVLVMTNSAFLERLSIVMELRQENLALRQHLAQVQSFMNRYLANQKQPTKARKAPAKRPAAKKSAAKKPVARNPQVRVKGSTASNRRAFKQGFTGR